MTTEPQFSRPADVAVGVVYDHQGRVLVNQRPAGKPMAGQWEFPGGKMRAGETATQALARELDEELGIAVQHQRPLIALTHRYADRSVRLHVNEVLDYAGRPEGREGQALDWVEPRQLDRIQLLAANAAIVRAIVLPRVCLITDLSRFGAEHTLERLARHTESRRVLLIVREKTLDPDSLAAFVQEARAVCRDAGSLIVVHSDSEFTDYDRVDGVHLSAGTLELDGAPMGAGRTGASCHTETDLRAAQLNGCDYALLSPVKHTESHPDARPLGWSGFAVLCRDAVLPVYALGGMTLSDLETAFKHGAQGVAMLRAAWR